MKFQVSLHVDIEADTPEDAAVEADRLLMTTRPKDFLVTTSKTGTVFIRVDRGVVKRTA